MDKSLNQEGNADLTLCNKCGEESVAPSISSAISIDC
jgi:hypothetical protein